MLLPEVRTMDFSLLPNNLNSVQKHQEVYYIDEKTSLTCYVTLHSAHSKSLYKSGSGVWSPHDIRIMTLSASRDGQPLNQAPLLQ